jgi:UDP-N-acetylmuramate dehydrogenase
MTLDIQENVPLAPLTTFKIGGPARYFVNVSNEEDIQEALAYAGARHLPFVVLAGKSNVLVPDEGLDALVIHIQGGKAQWQNETLLADAGCNLLSLIREAAARSRGGWEKLAGIPGTIGGAVRGNAGAFGPEIKDFVTKAHALNMKTGELKEFQNADCDFSYRHSFFKKNPDWVIVRVWLKLQEMESEKAKTLIKETIAEREKRHIQNVQAAGSFFVNPLSPKEVQELFEKEKGMKSREGRVPAGWLIEKAGMKGARVGDAVASEQHPNYLKNDGKATAVEVKELAKKIKDAVRMKFGIELHEEAVVL